jgi:hypothetical protein
MAGAVLRRLEIEDDSARFAEDPSSRKNSLGIRLKHTVDSIVVQNSSLVD